MRLLILSVIFFTNLVCIASSPLKPEELIEASETVGDPESPMYDENLYCEILKRAVKSPLINEAERFRANARLETARKNRPETKAADFTFIDRNGTESSLYDFKSDRPILLIFYDPDCSHCMEVFDELREKGVTDKVSILAIDAEDDKERWAGTASALPSDWTVGFSGSEIQDNETYIFLTSPTLYLLDPDKTVILKDATPDRVKDKLNSK